MSISPENVVPFLTGHVWKCKLEFYIKWKLLPLERLYIGEQSTIFVVRLEYTF